MLVLFSMSLVKFKIIDSFKTRHALFLGQRDSVPIHICNLQIEEFWYYMGCL